MLVLTYFAEEGLRELRCETALRALGECLLRDLAAKAVIITDDTGKRLTYDQLYALVF
ncbi:hypothetical protein BH10PSE7_BH10PSE7_03550 [soil metagenome]